MTDTTERHMTTDEIALMRAIIAWRKAHEIEFVRRRVMGTYWVDPFGRTGPERRSVAWDPKHDPEKPMGLTDSRFAPYVWLGAESFTQAVDVLVAYGYLPRRFSSAYRAGWHAAQQWYDDQARDQDEFNRLFHDPGNISFPAGVDA